MVLPSNPVTLTPEQLADLTAKLSTMRHDINNHLSLVIAASELILQKPEVAKQFAGTLGEQPRKIGASIAAFSAEFERVMGIKR